jgi:Outer membrane receptor proteins, mostly Fe transport
MGSFRFWDGEGISREQWLGASMAVLAALLMQGEALAAEGGADTSVAEQATASGASDEIQDVVVTARRKTEKAQDVPIPMTVIGGATLDEEGIHSIQELQQKLPSTNVIVNSPRMSSYAIRGLGATTIANEGLESSTGLYIDGVYLAKTGMAITDLNDIEQVELLRGPQGTLFGKNTTTGAFNFTTRKPTFTPELQGELTVGNYENVEFRGSASGPVVGDTLAARLTLYKVERDGYLDDPATGKHPNARNREGFRAQLLGVPNDDLSLRLIAEYHKDEYPQGFVPTLFSVRPDATFFTKLNALRAAGYNALPVSTDPYSFTSTGTHRTQYTNQKALTAQADWHLGGGWDLASVTSFRTWDFTPNNDSDFINLDIATCCGMGNRQKQFSQELRLSTPKGRTVETTAGLYYFWQDQRAYALTVYGDDPNLLDIWYFPGAGALWAGRTSRTDSDLKTNSYAAFAQSDWHVTDKVTLTGGLRETYEEKSIDLTRNLGGTNPALTDVSSISKDISNWNLSGTLALSYRPSENMNLYTSYAKGAKSATLGNAPRAGVELNGDELVVKPEKANDIEAGFKSQWFDRRLRLNGNLFYTLIQDYHTNVNSIDPGTGNVGLRLSNAAWVRSQGAELEISAQVLPGLTLSATGAYNDAKYRSFHNAPCPDVAVAATCDFTGRPLMGASRWTGNLSATYVDELRDGVEGYVNASYTYRSSYYGSVDLSDYGKIDAYGVTNLRVGARLLDSGVDLSLWARNLFDTEYYTAMGLPLSGAWFGYVGEPLTFGLTAKVRI